MKQPCALFVGDQDEQFIPEKVIAFGDYLSPSAKTHSYAQLIAGASHLSIILEAPHLLAQALEKFVMLKK